MESLKKKTEARDENKWQRLVEDKFLDIKDLKLCLKEDFMCLRISAWRNQH